MCGGSRRPGDGIGFGAEQRKDKSIADWSRLEACFDPPAARLAGEERGGDYMQGSCAIAAQAARLFLASLVCGARLSFLVGRGKQARHAFVVPRDNRITIIPPSGQ
jgi:hypothetical protein